MISSFSFCQLSITFVIPLFVTGLACDKGTGLQAGRQQTRRRVKVIGEQSAALSALVQQLDCSAYPRSRVSAPCPSYSLAAVY